MSIVSNYIWERAADGGSNPVSLALQQVKLRGREVCLFCLCSSPGEETGGRMTERLTEWFHRICLPACEGRRLPAPRELLEPELGRICGGSADRERGNYAVLLLTGNAFCLCGEGDVTAQLVNYRYDRPQMKVLPRPLSGRIQKGAGLLLHTPELVRRLRQEEVCQMLHGPRLRQEEGIDRRLRELYREGRDRGNTEAVGGIYLQVL